MKLKDQLAQKEKIIGALTYAIEQYKIETSRLEMELRNAKEMLTLALAAAAREGE